MHYENQVSWHEAAKVDPTVSVIITGAPRSGTKWAASQFNRMVGHPVPRFTHEQLFSLANVGNYELRDLTRGTPYPNAPVGTVRCVSWLAAPFVWSGAHHPDWKVFVMVRDPLRTIESIARRGFLYRGPYHEANSYGKYALKMLLPSSQYRTDSQDPVIHATWFWVLWMDMLLESGYPWFKVEGMGKPDVDAPAEATNSNRRADWFQSIRLESYDQIKSAVLRAKVEHMARRLRYLD